MNHESEKDMARDVEDHPKLYQALAGSEERYSWEEWVECPKCEQNDEITLSIRPESVGFWCDRCDISSFYE